MLTSRKRPLFALVLPTAMFTLACGGAAPTTELLEPSPSSETPAPAEQAPPLETGFMVIIGGDADEAAAKEKFEDYDKRGVSVGSFPALLESGKVQGLKPGFHIVVAAIPSDRQIADQMAAAIGETFEGTYVREVQMRGVESVDCAYPGADPRCFADPWEIVIVFDDTPNEASEDWAWFTDEVMTASKKAGVLATWADVGAEAVSVEVDKEEVGSVLLAPFWPEHAGYVFAREGQMPKYWPHAPVHEVLEGATEYFGHPIEPPG